jgi:hypothetical protein
MAKLNPKEMIIRLRTATESLSDPNDAKIVQDYLSELEAIAREQETEDAKPLQQQLDDYVRKLHGAKRWTNDL